MRAGKLTRYLFQRSFSSRGGSSLLALVNGRKHEPSLHAADAVPWSGAPAAHAGTIATSQKMDEVAARSKFLGSALSDRRASSSSAGKRVQVPLAQTGEGIKECELISWSVQVGQSIEEFAPLCEVQSDKATVEITSRFAGTVRQLHHAVGDIVQVGESLLEIEVTSSAEEAIQTASTQADAASCSPAATETPAAFDDEMAPLRQGVQHPSHADEPMPAIAQQHTPSRATHKQEDAAAAHEGRQAVLAAPAVRKLAKDKGVNLAQLQGTGPSARITREDVLAHCHQDVSAPVQRQQQPQQQTSPTQPESIMLRGYRRAMVVAMTRAAAIPHCHFFDDVAVDRLLQVRAAQQSSQLHGQRLTLLPFLLKALSVALQKHPEMNSTLAEDGASLLLHKRHNLGIAMATAHGLVVPNIKDVQDQTITELAAEMARLQALAQTNRLSNADLADGTLTVSNIGSIGGLHATPLISSREVAIIALGRARAMPSFPEGGGVVGVQMLPISWGADHRVLDGAALAKFNLTFKALIETPEQLLMHLR